MANWIQRFLNAIATHKANAAAHHARYTDAEVSAIIAAKFKADVVTHTTGADGKVSVTFAKAFGSTPIVIVQLENDVDYYPVITAKNVNGFTVKILKTAHLHSQGNTGAEAAHTHGISFASGSGSSHRHSNPSTGYTSAGTPSGTIGGESSHTHGVSFASGAGSAHKHTQGSTAMTMQTGTGRVGTTYQTSYCAAESGGSPTREFHSIYSAYAAWATSAHVHTNPDTSTESAHTHSVSGTSGAGSSHNHSFSGSALGTHRHSVSYSGYESSHTHSVSGTSGAGGGHSHTNPDTSEVNAGNALATTAVTFSYIAMIP